jgi:CRP/FNR family transcriptional regulator, global nitrogen regulator
LPRKVEARLANLLPLLALRFGTKAGGGTVILLRLTHEELAGMVSSTCESVTAALGDL